MMQLIIRSGKKGTYKCSYCGNNKEILVANAKRTKSCGCCSGNLLIESKRQKAYLFNKPIIHADFVEFPLSNGGYFKVDLDDLERVRYNTWYKSKRGYVETRENKKLVKLHRIIMQGELIDHINRDKLNNRKLNLRECTHKQNSMNSGPKNGLYKGISYQGSGKYRIRCNGKEFGMVNTLEEAINKYNEIAKKEYGRFAYLNKNLS